MNFMQEKVDCFNCGYERVWRGDGMRNIIISEKGL